MHKQSNEQRVLAALRRAEAGEEQWCARGEHDMLHPVNRKGEPIPVGFDGHGHLYCRSCKQRTQRLSYMNNRTEERRKRREWYHRKYGTDPANYVVHDESDETDPGVAAGEAGIRRPWLSAARSWMDDGACWIAPELFYSTDDEAENPGERRVRVTAAKEICESCPVMDLCAEYALTVHERYGVWGGLSQTEREEIWKVSDEPELIAS